jgi:hypothetical protein
LRSRELGLLLRSAGDEAGGVQELKRSVQLGAVPTRPPPPHPSLFLLIRGAALNQISPTALLLIGRSLLHSGASGELALAARTLRAALRLTDARRMRGAHAASLALALLAGGEPRAARGVFAAASRDALLLQSRGAGDPGLGAIVNPALGVPFLLARHAPAVNGSKSENGAAAALAASHAAAAAAAARDPACLEGAAGGSEAAALAARIAELQFPPDCAGRPLLVPPAAAAAANARRSRRRPGRAPTGAGEGRCTR